MNTWLQSGGASRAAMGEQDVCQPRGHARCYAMQINWKRLTCREKSRRRCAALRLGVFARSRVATEARSIKIRVRTSEVGFSVAASRRGHSASWWTHSAIGPGHVHLRSPPEQSEQVLDHALITTSNLQCVLVEQRCVAMRIHRILDQLLEALLQVTSPACC